MPLTLSGTHLQHQQREIEGLRFTVERLQLRLKEDQLINENLSRELTVLRSDKQFMVSKMDNEGVCERYRTG